MNTRRAQQSIRQLCHLVLVALAAGLPLANPHASAAAGQAGVSRTAQGLPTRWIDLPASPFHIVVSNGTAALINRTDRMFRSASVGCVRGEELVEVVRALVTVDTSGGWQPGQQVSVLGATLEIEKNLQNPNYRKLYPTLEYCADHLRVAVIHAEAADGYKWSAAGSPWPAGGAANPQSPPPPPSPPHPPSPALLLSLQSLGDEAPSVNR